MDLLKQMYADLKQILSSRTNRVALVWLTANTLMQLAPIMPSGVYLVLNAIMGALVVYYRVNTKATF